MRSVSELSGKNNKISLERWQGSRAVPCVHLCCACANNHTYILTLLCAHPFSTGLITFSLQPTMPYWHEFWPHNSHKTSGFLFLLTLLELAIEGKATVDTVMHNWSSLSCNTTSQAFNCLIMIRQRGAAHGGWQRWGSQVNGRVESWWKWWVCRDWGAERH